MLPELLEPDPDDPMEPEEPVEPDEPDEPDEPLELGEELPEAEPPMVVPEELGVEALELPLLPGVELELPVLPLVWEPPALSPPRPQADRVITAAAMTARVAPREKVEAFMLNSLVGIEREDRKGNMTAGRV